MKSLNPAARAGVGMSLPAWGAWIEIELLPVIIGLIDVAPRMGGVD